MTLEKNISCGVPCNLPQFVGLRGAMGGISAILVKNHFFILLNKFNLNIIIYDSPSVSDLYHCCTVICQAICKFLYHFKYLIKGDFNPIFLNFQFLSILTNSKCKSFYNFQAIKLKFFLHVPQCMVNKTYSSIFLYCSYFSKIKNKALAVETRNLVN